MPYFGKWPEWMDLYIESCKYNSTIDWLFFTDCGEPKNKAKNVRYIPMSFNEFRKLVSLKLGFKVNLLKPSSLFEFKPTYGCVFESYIKGYDYWGHGDIDLIYGDLRKFIPDDLLKYDLISFSKSIVSGPFALYKNTKEMNEKFKEVPHWKRRLKNNEGFFDERAIYSVIDKEKKEFSFKIDDLLGEIAIFLRYYSPKIYLKLKKMIKGSPKRNLKFLDPFPPKIIDNKYYFTNAYFNCYNKIELWRDGTYDFPTEWYWKNGKLTNNKDNIDFLFFHFVWKSNWRDERFWQWGAWKKLDKIVHIDEGLYKKGFRINKKGIFKLKK